MLSKKSLIVFFLILSLFNFTLVTATAQVVPVDKLNVVEILLYGKRSDSSILDRVERIEKTLYKEVQEGSLIERTNNIYEYVLATEDSPSLLFIINALEWSLTTDITQDTLLNKINDLEKMVLGEVKDNSLVNRINYLCELTFPGGKVPFERTSVPTDKLIKIEIFDEISTTTSKQGDRVRFQVLNDVYVNKSLVIPAGSTGTMEISKVEKSGKLGKEGEINLGFSKLMAIDGSNIKVDLQKEAQLMNQSQQLALGASILGAAVLGPVGLIAGYFVEGKEEKLPEGSQIYVQTVDNTMVYGFKIND